MERSDAGTNLGLLAGVLSPDSHSHRAGTTLVMPVEKNAPLEQPKLNGLTPEERFANHKAGIKDASLVKRYGIRLVPELYAHLNPMPYEAAVQMEKDLAQDLRRAGYTVTGGH
jgi:hypothetical protein